MLISINYLKKKILPVPFSDEVSLPILDRRYSSIAENTSNKLNTDLFFLATISRPFI